MGTRRSRATPARIRSGVGMPVRATKRGAERTPLGGDYDVVICGASFAGLAVARELRGSGARVLVVDRYEIGERQTSACAAPDRVAGQPRPRRVDPPDVPRPRHAPPDARRTAGRCRGRSRPSTTAQLCELLAAQGDFTFETAKVDGITRGADPHGPHRPRRPARAAGRRRARLAPRARRAARRDPAARRAPVARPGGPPAGAPATTSSCGWTRSTSRPGYSWPSPPATSCAPASARSTRTCRSRSRPCGWPHDLGIGPRAATRATGSRTGCARPTGDGVFFAGDSAGHCLPTTAEGIRTALYFGLAVGRELRKVARRPPDARAGAGPLPLRSTRTTADAFDWLWRVQSLFGRRSVPRDGHGAVDLELSRPRSSAGPFRHYLNIAPPSFALDGASPWATRRGRSPRSRSSSPRARWPRA